MHISEPVTANEVIDVAKRLAALTADSIIKIEAVKNQIISDRGGIPPQFKSRHTFQSSVSRLVENHCPQSPNFVSQGYFERLGNGYYRFIINPSV